MHVADGLPHRVFTRHFAAARKSKHRLTASAGGQERRERRMDRLLVVGCLVAGALLFGFAVVTAFA